MNNIFGFIGTGNMGGALARAAAGVLPNEQLLLSDGNAAVAQTLADELGCAAASVETVAKTAGLIFLGVKPQVIGNVLGQLGPILSARKDDFVLVSMAAGVSIGDMRRMAGADYPVIRIMPNIPVKVGCGVILYDATPNVSEAALAAFCAGVAKAGLVDRLPEHLIDAGSALSGCGPAFVSLFAEALADGAVQCGLPRAQAVNYALQTLIGTAQFLLATGEHPSQLKDAVCSPGGSTIAGIHALEVGGFSGCAAEAVICAYHRTRELGK